MTQWKAGDRAMTAAEAALIDRSVHNRKECPSSDAIVIGAYLVDAVLAERAPLDPVEVAIAAFLNSPGNTVEGIRAALKAYDAAKEKKS